MAINIIKSYIESQLPKDEAVRALNEISEKIKNCFDEKIKKIMLVDLEPLKNDPELLKRLIEKARRFHTKDLIAVFPRGKCKLTIATTVLG